MDFRDFLPLERARKGLSQAELATRLSDLGEETSPARVGHWETGRNTPPMENSRFGRALAQALRMSESELLAGLGYRVLDEQWTGEARRAAQIVESLPRETQATALEMLEVLARNYKKE